MLAMERACADYSASHSGLSLLRTIMDAVPSKQLRLDAELVLRQLLKVIAVCCLGD